MTDETPIRLTVVDVIPTPYRVPLYRRVHEDGAYDLHVYFCAETHADRGWGELELAFPHSVLRGIHVTRRGRNVLTYHLSPGIVRALLARRPDLVVVSGWAQPTSLLAAATARLLRIPYLVAAESHGRHPRSLAARVARAAVFSPVVRRAAAGLATGSRARDYLIEMGARPEGVFIRPNACDVDAIAHASDEARRTGEAERWRREIAGELPLVTFVGRLVRVKGVDVLLAALARLAAEGRLVAAAIAGGGPERAALERLTRDLGLAHVRFLGEVRPDRLPALYAASDVLCLPSLDEPWGVVVNEAMAAGLRVVVSDAVGAAPDLVRPGENGAVFKVGDAASLAAALGAALDLDPDEGGRRSREVVRSWDLGAAQAGLRDAISFARR